jgi:hypothetical protein
MLISWLARTLRLQGFRSIRIQWFLEQVQGKAARSAAEFRFRAPAAKVSRLGRIRPAGFNGSLERRLQLKERCI